jgi:GT2 family glycosyltransferase
MYAKAYILILNWNNWKLTLACLESVFRNSYPNYQVVLMDNGSTDGSIEKIKEWAEGRLKVNESLVSYTASNKPIPYIVYDKEAAEEGGAPGERPGCLVIIQNGMDLGVPGNNSGLKYAISKGDGDFLWLLNNDTVIHIDALTKLVGAAETDEASGIVGSKLLYYDRPGVIQAAGGGQLTPCIGNAFHLGTNEEDKGQWDEPFSPDYITGASLLVKKKVIEDIGFFDEKYFLCWEDVDLNVRAKLKGYRISYCPGSLVWHKEGGTVGNASPLMDYYWTRNGLFFTRKFYPMLLPLIPFAYFIKYTLVRVLRRQPLNFVAFARGVRDFLKGKTGEVPF